MGLKKRQDGQGESTNSSEINPATVTSTSSSCKPAAEDSSGTTSNPSSTDWFKVKVKFKKPDFQHSAIRGSSASGKKKQWRTLKQILVAEQSLPWPDTKAQTEVQTAAPTATPHDSGKFSCSSKVVTYSSIDGPPSFKPAKKYSDISGLPANYTDPHSKLNYAASEEFQIIRKLPSDIVAGYLTLRKANIQLQ